LANAHGAAAYVRVPAVGIHAGFIAGLARLAKEAAGGSAAIRDGSGQQHCGDWRRCACKVAA
jgi:hypothetical protein